MADGRPGGMIRAAPPVLYVAIAQGGTSEAFDVRMMGPGGWYTTTANATWSEAHFQGRQLARVTGLPFLDLRSTPPLRIAINSAPMPSEVVVTIEARRERTGLDAIIDHGARCAAGLGPGPGSRI